MPLGASRLNFLAKLLEEPVIPSIPRTKVGLSAVSNAQVDTAQSKFGGASALFDGTDDQINASDSAFVYGTNDLTIEFWFRVAVNNVNQSFVGNRYSTFLNDHWFISLRGSTGDVQLQIQTAADYRTQILTSAVNTNTWYHFAAVRDGNTFEVFLDGVSQGTGTNTGSIGTSDLYIGSRGDLGLDVNGHIDELRISSVARYTANFTPQTSAHVNDSDTILLAHMNGTDGSTTFTDDNGTRAPVGLSAVGNAQVDTAISKFGGASALFDGNDGINADNPLIPATDNWTVEGWFYPTNIGATDYLWSQYATGQSGRTTGYHTSSGAVGLFINGGPSIGTAAGTMSNNNWYHLAFTRSGSNFAIYVNGVSSATGTGTPSIYQGQPFVIGAQDTVGTNGFIGQIDDIRVSSTVRYTSNFTPPTAAHINDSDTILLTHMNGTDGSTDFFDDNGTRAQVGLSAVGNAQVDTANSQFGGASALFDGIDDYITVPNGGAGGDFDFGANDFTIEAWINMDTTSGTQNVLAWWSSTYGDGRSFFFGNTNGELRFNYYTSSGTFRNVLGAGTLSANTWHHIAIVGDSTNFKTYIDGTNAATASRETIDPISGTNPCSIGATNYGAFDFDGHIDELRVSSSARYTANFTPSTSAFTNDSDTVLLVHADGTDGSTTFRDDNS